MKIPYNFRDWTPSPLRNAIKGRGEGEGRGTRRKTEEEERKIMKRSFLTSFNFL